MEWTFQPTEPALAAYFEGTLGGGVRVFVQANSNWVQLGNDIYGKQPGDRAGRRSLALSAGGDTLVVGGHPARDSLGVQAGVVRVYALRDSIWRQVGKDIWGRADGDAFGASVSITSTGGRIAGGAPGYGTGVDTVGAVYVLDWDGSAWGVAASLYGTNRAFAFGNSVSLSADGTELAVGTHRSDRGTLAGGEFQVFSQNDNRWDRIGAAVVGDVPDTGLGRTVVLSKDGKLAAVSAAGHDGKAGENTGKVVIYEVASLADLTHALDGPEPIPDLHVYPNPAHDRIMVRILDPTAPTAALTLVEARGRVVLHREGVSTAAAIRLHLTDLTPGLYQLRVRSGNRQGVKRIVVRR